RKAQLEGHRDAESVSVAQRLGLIDARRIVIAAYELVRDPRTVREYMTASRSAESGVVPFGEFIRFEPTLHDPGTLGRAQKRLESAEMEAIEVPQALSPVSLDAQALGLLDEAHLLVQNLRDRREREALTELDNRTPSQKAWGRRRKKVAAFLKATTKPGGTSNRGPLTYGVGEAKRGLISISPAFILLFGVLLTLMIVTSFDQFEARYDGRSPLAWIRAGLMLVLTITSIRLVRSESLSRLGWNSSFKSAFAVLVALPALWFLAGFALPFEVKGEPTLIAVAAVVAVRAISEALFFEGLIHRTLLVEISSAPAAHALTVAAYVVYMNTYRFLWDPSEPQHAGAVLYGLIVALPAAYTFYRTRSWPLAALARFAALGGCAWAAFQTLT
ncbi:MAG: hypothetical protein ACJAYU_002352, partial [Bradymonadia bacterium]